MSCSRKKYRLNILVETDTEEVVEQPIYSASVGGNEMSDPMSACATGAADGDTPEEAIALALIKYATRLLEGDSLEDLPVVKARSKKDMPAPSEKRTYQELLVGMGYTLEVYPERPDVVVLSGGNLVSLMGERGQGYTCVAFRAEHCERWAELVAESGTNRTYSSLVEKASGGVGDTGMATLVVMDGGRLHTGHGRVVLTDNEYAMIRDMYDTVSRRNQR